MNILIFSPDPEIVTNCFSFLRDGFPQTQIKAFNPNHDEWPGPNDFDLIILDTLDNISDIVLRLISDDYLERTMIRLNENSSLKWEDLIRLGFNDVFSAPLHPTEVQFKIHRFFDLSHKSFFKNSIDGLSLKQQMILEVLNNRRTMGATRGNILKFVWGNQVVEPRNVDVHIASLRKVLQEKGKSIRWRKDRWFLEESYL